MTAKKRKLILINPGSMHITLSGAKVLRFPNLGLGYIAALTPDHWDIEMIDENYSIARFKECDLVGISVKTSAATRAYQIAAEFRKRNVPVIMGGIHPSMCQEEALQHVDTIVMGEAENTWPQVIEDFESGNLKSVYKPPGFTDLSKLIMPRKDLFDKRYYADIIQTTRGCPFQCEFCAVHSVFGKQYRKRPIDSVIEEIKLSKKRYFAFSDDNLMGYSEKDYQRFIELCKAMIKHKIKKRWFCQASMNCFENDEVLYYAQKSGCKIVIVGIESIEEKTLDGQMDKKVNVKYINENLTKKSHRYGIAWGGAFIVGNDEDTPATFDRFLKYIDANSIDAPQFGFLTPFPGTNLEKRLEQDNRLCYRNFPNDWQYYYSQSQAFFDTKNMTRKEVNMHMRRLARKNFAHWRIIKRTLNALFYSRDIVTTLMVVASNYLLRKTHFKAPYFLEKDV